MKTQNICTCGHEDYIHGRILLNGKITKGKCKMCLCKKFVPVSQNHSLWICEICNSKKKSSHKSICHKCYMRAWVGTKKGSEWQRKYKGYNSLNHNKNVKKWEQENVDKVKAKHKAQEIPIPKNKLCQKCNFALATERHHPDYSKPKEVFFVCKPCHIKLDMERSANG